MQLQKTEATDSLNTALVCTTTDCSDTAKSSFLKNYLSATVDHSVTVRPDEDKDWTHFGLDVKEYLRRLLRFQHLE